MARNRNRILVREAQQALDNFKYEVANELGINYTGDLGALTSRQNGYVGGIMVKKMIHQAQTSMAGKPAAPAPGQ
ncbi:MAG TPA: alpha/beta-type small acid-soluble spore protein [Firmicutes bacterium]|nr:alpha/beta-type small acid-soluble spore protein [Bacillota bacterium]